MVKFSYIDPISGETKIKYTRGFASKREAKQFEEDFLENLTIPEEEEEEKINEGLANTETVNSGSASSDENNDNDRGVLLKLTDQDVSKTLLALRKSSIDSLLN